MTAPNNTAHGRPNKPDAQPQVRMGHRPPPGMAYPKYAEGEDVLYGGDRRSAHIVDAVANAAGEWRYRIDLYDEQGDYVDTIRNAAEGELTPDPSTRPTPTPSQHTGANGYVTKDSGERIEFDSGMRRDTQEGKPRFDLLMLKGLPFDAQFLTRCAALLTRGAEKYGTRNFEKANSRDELDRFVASASRHFHQWQAQQLGAAPDGEDHAAAVFFNLMAAESLKWKLQQAAEAQRPGAYGEVAA